MPDAVDLEGQITLFVLANREGTEGSVNSMHLRLVGRHEEETIEKAKSPWQDDLLWEVSEPVNARATKVNDEADCDW